MSTKLKAIPYISQRRLIKSNRSEYTIGIKFLDNVWLEITKRFYTQKKAIEEMKKIVNLLNAFNVKVEWSVLDEKNNEKDKKDKKDKKAKGKDTNYTSGQIRSPKREKSISITNLPF